MLDIFIALFGGAYSAGKILAEKSELNGSKQTSERHMSRLNAWRVQVVDRALEEDLRNYVAKHENREFVWMEICGIYQRICPQKDYISADDWALDGALDKTKSGRQWYKQHRFDEPLDIMLAKRGKLRSDRASLPIAHLFSGDGQQTRADWDRTVSFWTCIRDELRRCGVDARLLFRCGNISNTAKRQYFDIDKVETFRYQHGDLVWLPDTPIDL